MNGAAGNAYARITGRAHGNHCRIHREREPIGSEVVICEPKITLGLGINYYNAFKTTFRERRYTCLS